jgi:type I restriction enzyme R subunit
MSATFTESIVEDAALAWLGDECLRFIARELLKTIRENVTIDWTAKESVRAKLRVMVKRILRKNGYPPDKQEKATKTVLEQAELLCAEWDGQAGISIDSRPSPVKHGGDDSG